MPITQYRMIAVLDAYRTIVSYFSSASTTLDAAISGMKTADGKHAQAKAAAASGDYQSALRFMGEAFDDLATIASEQLNHANKTLFTANMILMEEEAHFKMRRKYNDRKRVQQRDVRDTKRELTAERYAQLGIEPTSTTPPRPGYDATNDGIPEIGPEYTREDYDRERAERRKLDAERQASGVKSQ